MQPIPQYLAVTLFFNCSYGDVDVGVDADVDDDVDAGVIYHAILPAAQAAGSMACACGLSSECR